MEHESIHCQTALYCVVRAAANSHPRNATYLKAAGTSRFRHFPRLISQEQRTDENREVMEPGVYPVTAPTRGIVGT